MKFEYYTLYRSPGPGCQPMDGLVDVVDFNGRIRTEDGVTAWGKVVYDRPLTDAEIRNNELAKVK